MKDLASSFTRLSLHYQYGLTISRLPMYTESEAHISLQTIVSKCGSLGLTRLRGRITASNREGRRRPFHLIWVMPAEGLDELYARVYQFFSVLAIGARFRPSRPSE